MLPFCPTQAAEVRSVQDSAEHATFFRSPPSFPYKMLVLMATVPLALLSTAGPEFPARVAYSICSEPPESMSTPRPDKPISTLNRCACLEVCTAVPGIPRKRVSLTCNGTVV